MDEPAFACRAVAHAELDEAGEGNGVRAEPRRGEVREQRERGGQGPLEAEAGECGEERVRPRLCVEAAAAPASGGKEVAREAFEQGVHQMQEEMQNKVRRVEEDTKAHLKKPYEV